MEPQRTEASPKALAFSLLSYWGIVLSWMVVISFLSSEAFSAENTSRYIDPVLRYFFPRITAAQFVVWHSVIRKSAHFAEFFVLGSLMFWALRRGRSPRWRVSWMLQALGLAVLYSLADELHQALAPSRTPSLFDSGVDSLGAVMSQAVIYLRHLVLTRLSPVR
jgi:VanZ family protein